MHLDLMASSAAVAISLLALWQCRRSGKRFEAKLADFKENQNALWKRVQAHEKQRF